MPLVLFYVKMNIIINLIVLGLEHIDSVVLVKSIYSQDGDHHRIISCLNGNSLVEVTIPLNKEPLLSRVLKVVPFEDVLGSLQDKIEIIEYFNQYMYALTQRKNLCIFSFRCFYFA